jgi:LAO/AO transport system kinase
MKKVEMIIMPEIPKSDLHPSWVPEDANETLPVP